MSGDWIMAASMTMDAGLTEMLGYTASGLVLAAFSVRSITTLRSVAIASNLLFIVYAACAGLMPVLLLHAVLLPLNLIRLWQARHEGGLKQEAAAAGARAATAWPPARPPAG